MHSPLAGVTGRDRNDQLDGKYCTVYIPYYSTWKSQIGKKLIGWEENVDSVLIFPVPFLQVVALSLLARKCLGMEATSQRAKQA